MKKIVSIILTIVLCSNLAFSICANAENTMYVSEEICSAIIYELSLFESTKSSMGMENVDFENLYIGQAIPVYRYMNSGMNKVANVYPLFEDKQIVTLFYEVDELQFQIMTSLVNGIRESGVDKCALIYDAEGCYLYDGDEIYALGYGETIIAERKCLTSVTSEELATLLLGDLTKVQFLNYITNQKSARTQTNYVCNASYVPQGNYNICWAATIATIVNSVQGRSLTAVNVAKAKFGATNFNNTLTGYEAISFMNSKYSMGYVYGYYLMPTDDVIITNIQQGYPLYGHGINPFGDGHAMTIYGINATAGRIMIMDSNFGSTTAYYRNAASGSSTSYDPEGYYYRYVNPNSNIEYAIQSASCRYW